MAHFLQSSLEYVAQQRRAGTTLEQLLATTTAMPGAPDFRGEGIERVLRAGWVEMGDDVVQTKSRANRPTPQYNKTR